MSQVEEIEAAIERLSTEDYKRIAEWDRQMDADSASGKLDLIFDQADAA